LTKGLPGHDDAAVGRVNSPLISVGAALLALLGSAASSGLLIPDARAQVARKPDDEHEQDAPLLLVPSTDPGGFLGHTSHSSHSSHSSHRSHYSGSSGGGGGTVAPSPAPEPAPPPPKPASVSFVAYPGGRIFVDGHLAGTDATGIMTLKPGSHTVKVENRFLGEETRTIDLIEGQIGPVEIDW
jgi:hypothetical protein